MSVARKSGVNWTLSLLLRGHSQAEEIDTYNSSYRKGQKEPWSRTQEGWILFPVVLWACCVALDKSCSLSGPLCLCTGGVKFDVICGTILLCGPGILWLFFSNMVRLPAVSIFWSLCGLYRKVCEFHLLRGFRTASPTTQPWVKTCLGPEEGVRNLLPALIGCAESTCHHLGLRTPSVQ